MIATGRENFRFRLDRGEELLEDEDSDICNQNLELTD